MTSAEIGGIEILLYWCCMVMLMFCIIILMYVYGKERKKRNTPLSMRGCMYACKKGRQTCWFFSHKRSRIPMKVMFCLVLTLRRLALIELYELGM